MSASTWRTVTWNLRGSAGPDLDAVAAVVRDLSPDVLALQEVRRHQAAHLGGLLGFQHRWARKHHPYSPLAPWTTEGLALLTPHDIGEVSRHNISPGVSTWTYRHRVVLAATIHRGADELRVYDTHLASGPAPDERIAQAARVASVVIADSAATRIVMGDLNAPGEVEVIRELRVAGLRDPGGGPTNPSIAPRQRLDYVLVPDTATVVEQHEPDGGEDWWAISDHLPVLVAFET
ncbi:MAG: endonuclease/exonuclease/phosphatase family protein [Ilumatobacteraceae bacterium]|jgi:endonuclease/exonuclease/phosphatase family metal-dependent hydrolase